MASKKLLLVDLSKDLLHQLPVNIQKMISVFLDTNSKMQLALTSKGKEISSSQRFEYFLKKEEDWVKEGMAQLFEWKVTGRFFRKHLEQGLEKLTTPLITSYDHGHYQPELYGHHLLYFYYLTQNCGGENLFWEMAQGYSSLSLLSKVMAPLVPAHPSEDLKGANKINYHLLSSVQSFKLQCRDFQSSALHFQIARILNQDLWDHNDEGIYRIYPYHPSPIMNLYTHGIERVMPLFMPFVLVDSEQLKSFPRNQLSKFKFIKIKLSIPRDVAIYSDPNQLLDSIQKTPGEVIVVIKVE